MLTIATLVYAITTDIVEMTRRNIDTLLENTTGDFEVRVLVNGGPVMAFRPHPNLVPIYHAERLSIAAAYNMAFSCAAGDTLACVHNDVRVPYAWNEGMGDYLTSESIVFPMVREDAQEAALRGVRPTQAFMPPGCCFMLSKGLYEALGRFDEAFAGCHFEDTDLWMKAVLAGKTLVRAPVTVEHGRGKTRTELPDTGNGSFRVNQQIYINRYRREDGNVPLPILPEEPEGQHGIHREQQSQNLS